MNREEILNILRNIRNLPTLPDVVMEILRLCESPNSTTREIAKLVEKDPVLTTKVLKLVNSSYFGLSRELFSVNQALVLIGYNNLKNLILSASMLQVFSQDSQVGAFSRKALWKHSIGVAIAARFLANRYGAGDPEQAFVAGLIHDVGKVIIDWFFHSHFVQIIDLIDREQCWIRDAEQRVMQVTHEEVGSYLAARWNLPNILGDGIAYHHQPSKSREHAETASLVQLADILVRSLDVGYGGDNNVPELDEQVPEILSMNETPEGVLSELSEEMERSQDLFEMFS
jgi:putative nucleotidyltransferase with HDIG domain